MLPFIAINIGTDTETDTDIDRCPTLSTVQSLQGCEPQTPSGPGTVLRCNVAWPRALTCVSSRVYCALTNVCKVHSHPLFPI